MLGLKTTDIGLGTAIILILAVMLIPMPTFLLDVFLAMNILGALVILFVALYALRPLDFSVFPSLLLMVTLFRLALNVATTRLILGRGYAGEIIQGFGSFVVAGNYVVGFIIFLIPAAVETMRAGIWATKPSPTVRRVYFRAASARGNPTWRVPMTKPPIILIPVMSRPAMASPRTNLLAPSIAP